MESLRDFCAVPKRRPSFRRAGNSTQARKQGSREAGLQEPGVLESGPCEGMDSGHSHAADFPAHAKICTQGYERQDSGSRECGRPLAEDGRKEPECQESAALECGGSECRCPDRFARAGLLMSDLHNPQISTKGANARTGAGPRANPTTPARGTSAPTAST